VKIRKNMSLVVRITVYSKSTFSVKYFKPEDGGNMFHRNNGNHLLNYMASFVGSI
jgi:hypothetical protein